MPDSEKTTQDTVTLWPLPDIKHVYLLAAGILLGVMLGPAVLGRALPNQYDQWFNPGGDTAELDQAHAEALALQSDPAAFIVPPDIIAQLARYDTLATDAMEARLDTMRNIEVTPQAIAEERATSEQAIINHHADVTTRAFEARRNHLLLRIAGLEKEQVKHRHAHQLKLIGIQMALILALIAFAIAEALLAPAPGGQGASDRRVASPRLAHLVTVRYALLAGWLCLALAQPAALKQISPYFAGLLVVVVLVVGFVPLGKKNA